jgi:heat shock protein HspQ
MPPPMTLRDDHAEASGKEGVRTIKAKLAGGQLIHHQIFDYLGVIVDVDPRFMGSQDWCRLMAMTTPPRERP